MGRYEAVHGQHERGKRSTAWLHAEDRECAAALCSGGNETGHSFLFSEEALHGFYEEKATCFPQQISLAGTFEPELGKRMGHCIAAEARAYGVHETFSPVMDLTRDPRYGRVEESFGEDTYLCSEFAREIVKGMQKGISADRTAWRRSRSTMWGTARPLQD